MPAWFEHPTFDPELAAILPALEGYVPVGMTLDRLPHFRAMSAIGRELILADAPVTCIDHAIKGYQGAEIVVSVIARKDHVEQGPGIFCIHGGGMVMGTRFAGTGAMVKWALEHDAVCVTIEYRLAPEHPAPTGVEDCYAGLCWMAAHARDLNFNPARLVIFGGSAGGGLAAGVSLLARDRGGPKLIGQLLQCPMLDDRNQTPSSKTYDGFGVWDRVSNLTGWRALLGERCDGADVSPYEAPARADDLSRLPPCFIDVGGAEVFRDECIAYAAKMLAAGGVCELHVWGGAFHGFYDIAPQSALAQACISARENWLRRLLAA